MLIILTGAMTTNVTPYPPYFKLSLQTSITFMDFYMKKFLVSSDRGSQKAVLCIIWNSHVGMSNKWSSYIVKKAVQCVATLSSLWATTKHFHLCWTENENVWEKSVLCTRIIHANSNDNVVVTGSLHGTWYVA